MTADQHARCEAWMRASVDGRPGRKFGCSLEAGHEDAHAYVVAGVEQYVWVTDGDYSGPRAARLLGQLADEKGRRSGPDTTPSSDPVSFARTPIDRSDTA